MPSSARSRGDQPRAEPHRLRRRAGRGNARAARPADSRAIRAAAGGRRGRPPGRSAPAHRPARPRRAIRRPARAAGRGRGSCGETARNRSGSAAAKNSRLRRRQSFAGAAEDDGTRRPPVGTCMLLIAQGCTRDRAASVRAQPLGGGGIAERPGLDPIIDALVAEIGAHRDGGEPAQQIGVFVLQPRPFARAPPSGLRTEASWTWIVPRLPMRGAAMAAGLAVAGSSAAWAARPARPSRRVRRPRRDRGRGRRRRGRHRRGGGEAACCCGGAASGRGSGCSGGGSSFSTGAPPGVSS